MNEPAERPGQLWPMPARRRRRLVPALILGLVALVVGAVFDIAFVWGLGIGMVLISGLVLLFDRLGRRDAA